jgi:hypothetical protein
MVFRRLREIVCRPVRNSRLLCLHFRTSTVMVHADCIDDSAMIGVAVDWLARFQRMDCDNLTASHNIRTHSNL